MKVGDLVTVRIGKLYHGGFLGAVKNTEVRYTKGIILDCLEGSDGFWNYEVLFEEMVEWFSDLELKAFNESR